MVLRPTPSAWPPTDMPPGEAIILLFSRFFDLSSPPFSWLADTSTTARRGTGQTITVPSLDAEASMVSLLLQHTL